MTVLISQKQVAQNSILDAFDRQTYLGNAFHESYLVSGLSAGAETPLLLIKNPAAATVSLFNCIKRLTALGTSSGGLIKIYTGPTVTANGTPQTPANRRPGSTTTPQGLVYLTPSVSANGTLFQALAATSYNTNESDLLQILDPGQTVLVTVTASGATTPLIAEYGWYEL